LKNKNKNPGAKPSSFFTGFCLECQLKQSDAFAKDPKESTKKRVMDSTQREFKFLGMQYISQTSFANR
jgi:hypothetical protein